MSDKRKIRTDFWMKPIPPRQFDWCATFDDYEGGGPIGYGATEQEAIADLLDIDADDNGQFGVGA
jgi:hypothetical protein